MRGASALEKVLEEDRSSRVRAFVVWEPVLWTDLGPPSTRRLASIPDTRVGQYWDPKRLVSDWVTSSSWAAKVGIFTHGDESSGRAMAWDVILLIPRGSCGRGGLPEPEFHGDPVVTTIREAQEHLRALAWEPTR